MTKKKAIMYTIIFVVLFCAALIFRAVVLYDPSKNFDDMCKNVFAPSCQVYINKITEEKKYDEAIAIRKERIRQSKQIMNVYKRRITDKCLLQMNEKEADTALMACIGKKKGRIDYLLLKTTDAVIQDIIIDTVAVAILEVQANEDTVSAYNLLKSTRNLLKKNPYAHKQPEAIKYIESMMSELD